MFTDLKKILCFAWLDILLRWLICLFSTTGWTLMHFNNFLIKNWWNLKVLSNFSCYFPTKPRFDLNNKSKGPIWMLHTIPKYYLMWLRLNELEFTPLHYHKHKKSFPRSSETLFNLSILQNSHDFWKKRFSVHVAHAVLSLKCV